MQGYWGRYNSNRQGTLREARRAAQEGRIGHFNQIFWANLDLVEAIQNLAREFGIELEKDNARQRLDEIHRRASNDREGLPVGHSDRGRADAATPH